jgi:hypothetical protein
MVQQIWDRFRITITTTTTSRRTVIVMLCIKMTATATAITDADTTISDLLVLFILPILLDRTIYIYIYIYHFETAAAGAFHDVTIFFMSSKRPLTIRFKRGKPIHRRLVARKGKPSSLMGVVTTGRKISNPKPPHRL